MSVLQSNGFQTRRINSSHVLLGILYIPILVAIVGSVAIVLQLVPVPKEEILSADSINGISVVNNNLRAILLMLFANFALQAIGLMREK